MKRLLLLMFMIMAFPFAAVFIGCNHDSKALTSMDRAERLISEAPDSALTVLKSIDRDALHGDREQARYALLMSMALDKNYVDTTSFDILQPAIDYYLKKGSTDEKLRTYYYQGRIYQNRCEYDSALYCFLNGKDFLHYAADSMTAANLLVAEAAIQYSIYKFNEYTDNHIAASRLYNKIGNSDYELSCLMCALDGSIINHRKYLADSIVAVAKQIVNNDGELSTLVTPHILLYELEFGGKEQILEIIDNLNPLEMDDLTKIDIAEAYYKIGDPANAKRILLSLDSNVNAINSWKYLAIKPDILEANGDFPEALEAMRLFLATMDSIHQNVFSQDLLFAQKKHEIEKSNLIEIHKSDRKFWITLCIALAILLAAACISYQFILSRTKNKLAEKEKIRLNLENENLRNKNELLELENKNTILEKQAAEQENQKRIVEAENLVLKIRELENERVGLKKIIDHHDNLVKPAEEAIRARLNTLNKLITQNIRNKYKNDIEYEEWCSELIRDNEEFMKSTRLAYVATYPKFIEYLQQHGLTEEEINYCGLYAIGLRGTEVGKYISKSRHYHVSSDIRRKLGIGEHDTNLGIHIRRQLSALQ